MARFTATGYAYPWDLVGDPDAAALLGDLGIDDVALAAAYHSVRAATPRHPQHRVVEATAGLYVPVDEARWRGRRLRPLDAADWAGDESFLRARRSLASVGLRARAWVVLTHSTAVGQTALDCCVRNAFGDVYPYALCPSNAEVRDYATTLAAEVARLGESDSMVVEACGPLGVGHQSRHEKTGGADWTPLVETLLSICFCAGCESAYLSSGIDVGELRTRVRAAVDGSGSGDDDPGDVLEPFAAPVLAVRRDAASALRTSVATAARAEGVIDVTYFASGDPWSTGPFAARPPAGTAEHSATDSVSDPTSDSVIVDAWALAPEAADRVRAARLAAAPSASVGAYCTVLPPTPVDPGSSARHWRALLDAGADWLHLYHPGLASDRRRRVMRDALAALRADQDEGMPDPYLSDGARTDGQRQLDHTSKERST